MLVAIAIVDLVGAGISFADAAENGPPAGRQVLIRVVGEPAGESRSTYVVATPDDETVATRMGLAGASQPFELAPGHYRVWFAGARLCSKSITVSGAPLQEIELQCP
jgi:hypothetical protein